MKYEKSRITITKMAVVQGSKSVNKYLSENYPDAPVIEFTMKIDAFNDTHIETQLGKLDDSKKLKNPVRPSFVGKDGTTVVATTAYELLKAIEVTIEPEKLEDWKKLGFSQGRYVNLPFEFEVGQAVNSDGGFFYKLNTEYQKQRDANYKGNSEAFDITDFNKGKVQEIVVSDELVSAVDSFAKDVSDNKPIDPSKDDLPW